MSQPIIYVIAGPNGIGKTTTDFNFIKVPVPVINSDEIAAEARRLGLITGNAQEYANQEALRMVGEFLQQRASFGIESNLADNDTWKFLLGIQKSGYHLHVIYISTDEIELLNTRIDNRVREGGHFVRPDIVRERYFSGLNLLNHYFDKPDKVQLFDNSGTASLIIDMEFGKVIFSHPILPHWIKEHLPGILRIEKKSGLESLPMNTLDEVRDKYSKLRQTGGEDLSQDPQNKDDQSPGPKPRR